MLELLKNDSTRAIQARSHLSILCFFSENTNIIIRKERIKFVTEQQDEQLKKIDKLLQELGYDVTKEEKKVFVDVVVETLDCIGQGMSKEEVYNLVHNKNAYIYVELAYFIYEKGMPKLHYDLEQFHQDRCQNNVNKQVFNTVFQETKNPDVFDSAFYVASYISDKNKNSGKVKQKRTTVN